MSTRADEHAATERRLSTYADREATEDAISAARPLDLEAVRQLYQPLGPAVQPHTSRTIVTELCRELKDARRRLAELGAGATG